MIQLKSELEAMHPKCTYLNKLKWDHMLSKQHSSKSKRNVCWQYFENIIFFIPINDDLDGTHLCNLVITRKIVQQTWSQKAFDYDQDTKQIKN